MNDYAYSIDGYLERKGGGRYEGCLSILGIDISPIVGVYFKNEKDGKNYLWLKRKKVMEYDIKKETFTERESRPSWESYLEKSINENDAVIYRGEFFFLRFRFRITGVWDKVLGTDKRHQRLNLFVERLPMRQQTIINSINERKRKGG